jgi:ferrochelatase
MTGVLLMTFGSATEPGGVPDYLRSVRGGREAPAPLVEEFQRRYRMVGRSPLVDITRAQGKQLQRALDQEHGPGRFLVEVGMLHSEPWAREAFQALVDAGCEDVIGLTLAPQFSPIILSGYRRLLDEAQAARAGKVRARLAGAWWDTPAFIDSLADRLTATLENFGPAERERVPVIFTAHSVPLPVVERDPAYIAQLTGTAEAIAARVGLSRDRWQFAYQSAGHTPEDWLKPDLLDVLPRLRAQGHREVLIAPLQFCADHLEVLYDLDVAAREQAEQAGIRYQRIEMPNTSPSFIRALRDVVDRELVSSPRP